MWFRLQAGLLLLLSLSDRTGDRTEMGSGWDLLLKLRERMDDTGKPSLSEAEILVRLYKCASEIRVGIDCDGQVQSERATEGR